MNVCMYACMDVCMICIYAYIGLIILMLTIKFCGSKDLKSRAIGFIILMLTICGSKDSKDLTLVCAKI